MQKSIISLAVVFAASTILATTAHAIPGTNPLPRTGQGEAGKCYDWNNAVATEIPCAGSKQDGETRKGVAWPGTRFTDNGNGTVTDNLTGLIWLQDVTCLGSRDSNNATTQVAALQTGNCGLSDGSTAGKWRLPNYRELESLFDINYVNPALTAGHPFIMPVIAVHLWSSTLAAGSVQAYNMINTGYGSSASQNYWDGASVIAVKIVQ